MKKRPVQTKEDRQREINFLRKASGKIRKHKKLINGRMTKEDLVELLAALWKNFEKITVKVPKLDEFGYYVLNRKNEVVYRDKRRYSKIPAYNSLNKVSRKILVGIYGNTLQLARKEGLFNYQVER